jgi:hypothetical protein
MNIKQNYFKLTTTFLLLIGFATSSQATHVMGSDIFYRHLTGMQYEIKIVYYRDCRGIPFANPSSGTSIRCAVTSGTSIAFSLTLQSIKDVTPSCTGAKSPCDPQNTFGTGTGVEEHVYVDTIDFNTSPFNTLFNCSDDIVIQTQQCCRNGAITTGPGNANFYTYALFNFDIQNFTNSTPTFQIPPIYKAYINQPMVFAIGAIDTVDHDSLSFEFDEPLSAYKTGISYSGGLSYTQPFTAYYPGSFTPPYSNPNATPPIGIHLDSLTGTITATPVNASQVTVLVIQVKEWRKDASGVPQLISKTRRDCQIIFESLPDNNLPKLTITNPGIQPTGSGCVSFIASDKAFVAPPPAPVIRNDSLTVTLIGANSHLQMTIDSTIYDSSSSTVYGRVCYDSLWSTYSDNNIYLHVRDNACNWNSEVSRGIRMNFTRTTGAIGSINNQLIGINVYPNPVDKDLTITVPKLISNCQVDLVDINGKIVHTQKYDNLSSTILDLSSLSAGFYNLRVSSDQGNSYKKIIIK